MIEFIDKVVPDAYHGTSRANAENIIRTKRFMPSSGRDCFLGDGIYFFEAGKERAKWWAKKRHPRMPIGIIFAQIQLGRCLDLANKSHIEVIRLAKQRIIEKGIADEISDTLVINFLTKEIDRDIETVRGYFLGSRNTIFLESKIYEIVHIVICVKKQGNILNFRLL